jgi:hypothetical protein
MNSPLKVSSREGWAVYVVRGLYYARVRGDHVLAGPFRTQSSAEAYAGWKDARDAARRAA